jgi:cytosine/adenosine deaminase-related metal-dependent hydrolase
MSAGNKTPWTLTARWIFPVDGSPLAGGCVTIAGDRIVEVGHPKKGRPDVDLGDTVVLPGLVNAHTHLDLSGVHGAIPFKGDFTEWLRVVIRHRQSQTPDQIDAAIGAGLDESMRHGATLLGDIAGEGKSWPILTKAPLRAIVFREMLGLTANRASAGWARQDEWLSGDRTSSTCRPGVSPHASYSVRSSLFLAASTAGIPAAVHLAETREEMELLGHRRGPFVPFLREMGVWDPEGLAEGPDQILRLFNGASPALFVHCNYLPADSPIPANGSLVYCPRTHAAFGHPPHPFRDFLARGVRVALGTDSLASNPDLDLMGEARFLHRLHPDFPAETILQMATLTGAEALGWEKETGSLTPGKSADLVVFSLPETQAKSAAEALRSVLESDHPVQRTLFQGKWREA